MATGDHVEHIDRIIEAFAGAEERYKEGRAEALLAARNIVKRVRERNLGENHRVDVLLAEILSDIDDL